MPRGKKRIREPKEQTAQQWQWTWNKDDKQLATVNGQVHDYVYIWSTSAQLMKTHFYCHTNLAKYISAYGNHYPNIYTPLAGRAGLFIFYCPMGLYSTGLFTNNDFAETIESPQILGLARWEASAKLKAYGSSFDQVWDDFCESNWGQSCLSAEAQRGGAEWLKQQKPDKLLCRLQKLLTIEDYRRILSIENRNGGSLFQSFRDTVGGNDSSRLLYDTFIQVSFLDQLLELSEHHFPNLTDHQKRGFITPNIKFGLKCLDKQCPQKQNDGRKVQPNGQCCCGWKETTLMSTLIQTNDKMDASRANLQMKFGNPRKRSFAKKLYEWLPIVVFILWVSAKFADYEEVMNHYCVKTRHSEQYLKEVMKCLQDSQYFCRTKAPDNKDTQKSNLYPYSRTFWKMYSGNNNDANNNDNNNNSQPLSQESDACYDSNNNNSNSNNSNSNSNNNNIDTTLYLRQFENLVHQTATNEEKSQLPENVKKLSTVYDWDPNFKLKYDIDLDYHDKSPLSSPVGRFLKQACDNKHRDATSEKTDNTLNNEKNPYKNDPDYEATGYDLLTVVFEEFPTSHEYCAMILTSQNMMVKAKQTLYDSSHVGMWLNMANYDGICLANTANDHFYSVCGPAENAFLIMKQRKHWEFRSKNVTLNSTVMWICTKGSNKNCMPIGQILDENKCDDVDEIQREMIEWCKNKISINANENSTLKETCRAFNEAVYRTPLMYFKVQCIEQKHFVSLINGKKFKSDADRCIPLGKKGKLNKLAWFVKSIHPLSVSEQNCVRVQGAMGVQSTDTPSVQAMRIYTILRSLCRPNNLPRNEKTNSKSENYLENVNNNGAYGLGTVLTRVPTVATNTVVSSTIRQTRTAKKNVNYGNHDETDNEIENETDEPPKHRRRISMSLNYEKFKAAPAQISTNFISSFAQNLRDEHDTKEKEMYEIEEIPKDVIDALQLTKEQLQITKDMTTIYEFTQKHPKAQASAHILKALQDYTKTDETPQ